MVSSSIGSARRVPHVLRPSGAVWARIAVFGDAADLVDELVDVALGGVPSWCPFTAFVTSSGSPMLAGHARARLARGLATDSVQASTASPGTASVEYVPWMLLSQAAGSSSTSLEKYAIG